MGDKEKGTPIADEEEQQEQIAQAVTAAIVEGKTDVLIKADKTIRLRDMQRVARAAAQEGSILAFCRDGEEEVVMATSFHLPQCGKTFRPSPLVRRKRSSAAVFRRTRAAPTIQTCHRCARQPPTRYLAAAPSRPKMHCCCPPR